MQRQKSADIFFKRIPSKGFVQHMQYDTKSEAVKSEIAFSFLF